MRVTQLLKRRFSAFAEAGHSCPVELYRRSARLTAAGGQECPHSVFAAFCIAPEQRRAASKGLTQTPRSFFSAFKPGRQGSSVVEQRTHKPFVGSSNLPLGTSLRRSEATAKAVTPEFLPPGRFTLLIQLDIRLEGEPAFDEIAHPIEGLGASTTSPGGARSRRNLCYWTV